MLLTSGGASKLAFTGGFVRSTGHTWASKTTANNTITVHFMMRRSFMAMA
jgi:hypothetical protein